jgi:Cu(I)/Ag(I) efflux system membrane fusion protein
MLSTLPKHRGANGPVIALGLLVVTVGVVLFTQPREKSPSLHIDTPRVETVAPVPAPPPGSLAPAPEPTRVEAAANTVGGTGIIGYDESKTSHLATPVAGWLEKTRTNSLGRSIRAGETLAVVHSPEVFVTSVAVLRQMKEYRSSTTLDIERTRLLRWGMPPWTLTKMQKTGVPEASMPLIARVSGTVVAEQGDAGGLVDPWSGVEYFTITDPTRYWIYVDVPAGDAARMKVGASTKVIVEGKTKPIAGRVGYVYRRVEDGMRSVRIDIQTKVPLRVGDAATAEIKL